mmetsp:Transcript_121431/g.259272  ORF Transcript_121431/g.259272 Transcript_121431/m.259272 type:complete len:164 (+) Transcript_121431:86-577(+)
MFAMASSSRSGRTAPLRRCLSLAVLVPLLPHGAAAAVVPAAWWRDARRAALLSGHVGARPELEAVPTPNISDLSPMTIGSLPENATHYKPDAAWPETDANAETNESRIWPCEYPSMDCNQGIIQTQEVPPAPAGAWPALGGRPLVLAVVLAIAALGGAASTGV